MALWDFEHLPLLAQKSQSTVQDQKYFESCNGELQGIAVVECKQDASATESGEIARARDRSSSEVLAHSRPMSTLSPRSRLCADNNHNTAIMATELTVQSERAYQKQPHIFVNQKTKRTRSTKVGKGGRRWYKDVGLGFRTPKTAIEGTYIGTTGARK